MTTAGHGSLTLVFLHGRTLGTCVYAADPGEQQTRMHCTLATGMDPGLRQIVHHVGRILYRLSFCLQPENMALGNHVERSAEEDWTAQLHPTAEDVHVTYTEKNNFRMRLHIARVEQHS